MATLISERSLSEAWVRAYEMLAGRPEHDCINLVVEITDPLAEVPEVRRAIDGYLARKRGIRHSCHTVANTIFPISLYRPEYVGAAERFLQNALNNEAVRSHARARQWGTYLGRLVAFPGDDGRINQLELVLARLRGTIAWHDIYEMPLDNPTTRDPSTQSMPIHRDVGHDRLQRGGPCLTHLSLTRSNGALHLTALYRRHEYETRAYGNFMGLCRLLHFLARESGLAVGTVTVVASHAVADGPRVAALQQATSAALSTGTLEALEMSARPLGVSYDDYELPVP